MKNKSTLILAVLLIVSIGIIAYQNFISNGSVGHEHSENGEQLYTCGMHPDILSEEPGNCPICEMKLTPVKKDEKPGGEKTILYWAAPMDPNEIYDAPGKSKMGMDLVPVYSDEVEGGGIVSIDPVVQQNMNIKLSEVEKMETATSIRTNAVIKADERKDYTITSRVSGWIENLYVNFTGEKVAEGQKLMDIYSPELVAAQQEYITAVNYYESLKGKGKAALLKSGMELIENSLKKLDLLKMPGRSIKRLKDSRNVETYITIYSPASGVVIHKNIVDGEKITEGQKLMQITNLKNLWVVADIYESEISKIELGAEVTVSVDSYPSEQFLGKLSFIYPTMDEKTRTVKVRIDIPNKNSKLKPSMLAKAEISGKSLGDVTALPEDAVIRSGENNIAVLSIGKGKFKPVDVELGEYFNGYYRVLSGLREGDKVVTSAQFLIDSESSLKSAIKQFSKAEPVGTIEEIEHQHTSNEYGIDSDLIRTGVINVEAIDENGDGKLYECPMDWNIISDEAGRCPSCEMKLKEYSLNEVKDNLKKYGYKYE